MVEVGQHTPDVRRETALERTGLDQTVPERTGLDRGALGRAGLDRTVLDRTVPGRAGLGRARVEEHSLRAEPAFSRAFALGVPLLAIAYPLLTRLVALLHLWITGRELRAATAGAGYFFAFLISVFCVFAFGLSFDVKGRLGVVARVLAGVGLVLNVLFALRLGYA